MHEFKELHKDREGIQAISRDEGLAHVIRKVWVKNELTAKELVRIADVQGRTHDYDGGTYLRSKSEGLLEANLNMQRALEELGHLDILKGE